MLGRMRQSKQIGKGPDSTRAAARTILGLFGIWSYLWYKDTRLKVIEIPTVAVYDVVSKSLTGTACSM